MSQKTIALVTGANRGLGLEISRQLAARGLTVLLGARDAQKGEAAVAELKNQGLEAKNVVLDVGKPASVTALAEQLEREFGRLDILVNNAGVALWQSETFEAHRETFEANFFGVVAVTEALLPLIQKSEAGRIVNHSSVLGSLGSIEKSPEMFGHSVNGPYTSSKAALNGYTVALAHRLRKTSIKVNAAHPGWVKTALGGPHAPMDVVEGAKTAVRLATLPADGPSGQFFHMQDRLPW